MAIYNVKKDGTGTHTEIQAAIYDASNGDTINIGPGTWSGNFEIYKSVVLQGSGKTQTFLQGQLAAVTVSGCSFYAGEDTITCSSTASLFKGRLVTGVNITAGSRVSEIVSGTQFKVSAATSTTGIITKTGCTWSNGASTITLPSATSVVVGMKVQATGVSATVSAYNATTRVVTLSSPTTAAGSNATLTFKPLRSAVTVTMPNQFSGSTLAATVQFVNVATNGVQIKDMCITGFDGATNTESAALALSSPASGSHQNWLIDGCKLVAVGDQAIASSSNLSSNGGTIQNCVFEGTTFTGSEPAEVPAFSSFTLSGCSVLSTTTVQVSSTKGIAVGSPVSSTGNIQASTTVSAISGNVLTLNKTLTASVGASISCTFTNVQYSVPNVARQLVVIGNSSTVSACLNTTFKNNVINGRTGAVISASGSKSMFNTAVSIDTVGGLIEGNTIDGFFGAGDPNSLVSNFAIRSRGTGVVVQNNVNKITGGRGNSGFYIPSGTSVNNLTLDKPLVLPQQTAGSSVTQFEMDKSQLLAMSKVQQNASFSSGGDWYRVTFVYKKQGGTLRFVSSFRVFDSAKNTKLRDGMAPGDVFELHKIIISKVDRSMLVLTRSEIDSASTYDFTVA